MKQSVVILLAGIACIFILAAGCTSSSDSAAAVTPATTAAPGQTSVAATAATTALTPVATTAQPNTTAAPAPGFSGNWNATYTSASENATITALHLEQNGTAVTGTYKYTDAGNTTGTISGTVAGSVLSGSWNETATNSTYSGPLAFTLAADGNSFTGTWADGTAGAGAINNTTNTWNGIRV